MTSSDYAWIIDSDPVTKNEFCGFCGPVDGNQKLVEDLKSNRFIGKRFRIIQIEDSGSKTIAFKGRLTAVTDTTISENLYAPLEEFADSVIEDSYSFIQYRINGEWLEV